jgi:ankyrin repeat protein
MSTIDIISSNGKVLTINSDNPILSSGYFGLINKSNYSDLDSELLELIFSDNCEISLDKLIEYIPILSSLCLNDNAKQSYLKLFGMINENNHELINELIDDMINYFNVEEINKMPDLVASKFVLKMINDANINKIFVDAVKIGYIKTINTLVNEHANIYFNDNIAIAWASQNGHLDVVKYLLDVGADIHANNDCAIIRASENGHLDIVKYLLDVGADIHANNDCAIIRASENGHLDIVKFLFDNGADIHAHNNYAIRLASANGHLEIVKFLFDMVPIFMLVIMIVLLYGPRKTVV